MRESGEIEDDAVNVGVKSDSEGNRYGPYLPGSCLYGG